MYQLSPFTIIRKNTSEILRDHAMQQCNIVVSVLSMSSYHIPMISSDMRLDEFFSEILINIGVFFHWILFFTSGNLYDVERDNIIMMLISLLNNFILISHVKLFIIINIMKFTLLLCDCIVHVEQHENANCRRVRELSSRRWYNEFKNIFDSSSSCCIIIEISY